MPQALSIATALERARLDSDVPLLVALDIDVIDPATGTVVEQLHFVRNDEEVTFNGTLYTPIIFDITFGSEAGATPNVDLTVQEITGALQARMEAYNGGVGFGVKMMLFAADQLTSPPDVAEFFQVQAASMKDYTATFRLGGESDISKTFPRRRQTRDFCQWRFKDPETCGYKGPLQTCDLTLQGPNGCARHLNTVRFGGFQGLTANSVRYG